MKFCSNRDKAKAVAAWGFSTAQMATGARETPGFGQAPNVVTVAGGVPVYSADGKTRLGGIGVSGEAPEDAVLMEGTEVAVSALDKVFRVADIRIQAGATVTWTNKGRNEHDVLPAEGDGWGVDVAEFEPGIATLEHFWWP